MTRDVTPDAAGAHRVSADLWRLAGLDDSALPRLALTGDAPLLPTSFHVGIAAQSTIGCAALAATEIGRLRGASPQGVSVDIHDAEYECTGYFTLNGKVPSAWGPLSGLYPCRDGFVRIHANFTHHRDGALKLLGITDTPGRVGREQVAAALSQWDAADFEEAAARAGLVVAAVRSFAEWDRHPHAAAIAPLPLFTVERIGDAEPCEIASIDDATLPLSGLRVLDLTRILAGPICGRTLAAYGADVMLVNSPDLPNIDSIAETSRGKLSVQLDLRQADDAGHLRELIAASYVFVQGYRPGGLEALGFGPEHVADICPGIVYVSLSAYSPYGPWSDRRGFDSLVQTATGFNDAEAKAAGADRPKAMPVQILDCASGFLMALAAQAALLKQRQEGGSWHVQVSLAQTAHWLRGLGRVPQQFDDPRLDFTRRLTRYASGFGDMQAIPHAARLSRTSTSWRRPSMPPGSHPPCWPDD